MGANGLQNIQGKVLYASDKQFEFYRSVWNQAADGIPHVIVVPETNEDVSHAVQYASETRKSICVRGGGHHFAGLAVQNDAIMIHMGRMNEVRVEGESQTVLVGAGATIGDLDAATQKHGLAVPTGTSSGTGIAGLTLGGGFGHLRRLYGLTCDQLLSAKMVLANGDIVNVSAKQNPELFWAIRGAGGNFGIVTEFEFQAYPIGPEVAVLDVFYDISDLSSIISRLIDAPHTLQDNISFHLLSSPIPANSTFSVDLHGKWVIRLLGIASGYPSRGMTDLIQFRNLAEPMLDRSGIRSYLDVQSCLDANFPDGVFYDGTSVFLDRMTPVLIETVVELLNNPQPVSLQFWMLGGELSRRGNHETAYCERAAEWVVFVNAAGSDRDKLAPRAAWMRHAVRQIGRHAMHPTMYTNAIGKEELAQPSVDISVYGKNLARLRALKQTVDPTNVFRHNVNIRP